LFNNYALEAIPSLFLFRRMLVPLQTKYCFTLPMAAESVGNVPFGRKGYPLAKS
jgi:hypothetical protein